MLRNLFVITAGLYSSLTFAHPGHDHSHWMSDSIHLLSIGAIITIIATAAYSLKKHYAKQSTKSEEK